MRLKMMMACCVGLLLLLTVVPTVTHAEVPDRINYQGFLTDSDGNPVPDDIYEMVFNLHTTEDGDTGVWQQTSSAVSIVDGIYNVELGPFGYPGQVFDGDLYLEVEVNGEVLSPRQRLSATAYAMRAVVADVVADGAITSVMIANGAVDSNKVADNAITSAKIVNNSITAADILDGIDSGLNADKLDGLDASAFITGVNAGTGLSGGGTSGTVTLNVDMPFELTGNEDPAIISASNGYSVGYGVYGEATNVGDYGNYGGYFKAAGVYGRAVYGEATGTAGTNHGGFFIGHGPTGRGVFAEGKGTEGIGVKGWASNNGDVTNYGGYFQAEGVNGRGVYAEAPATGYAGEFNGKVLVSSGGVEFPDGTVQTTAAAPTWHQKFPTAAERFVLVMDNQAVLDKETGLVWARNANIYGLQNWQTAINYCANLNISSRKGWRLPEKEELASLLDMSVSGSPKLPAGYSSFFTNVQSLGYWSSTTFEGDSSGAWVVFMDDGSVDFYNKDYVVYVWPVRSGN